MADPDKGNDRAAIWAVVTLTGLALAAVTTLAALGRPLDSIVQLIVLIVPTTVGSLLTLLRVERMGKDVSVVREQTNGNMSRLIDRIPPQTESNTQPRTEE